MQRPRVVIIGGGFGGLYAARGLAHAAVDITLIDRRNHHLFQPLLYQVATAGLSAPQIAAPIRQILGRQKNVSVLLVEASRIDTIQRVVHLNGAAPLPYDYLVLAAGAVNTWFGNDSWAQHAPGLKSLDDAMEIRRRVLLAFERAELTEDEAERAALMRFVVIGGGPTGVEMAGALVEIATRTLPHDFRRIDPTAAQVILVEGGDKVLPGFKEVSSEAAKAALIKLGVQLRLGQRVTHIDGTGVSIGDERLATRTVLWGAGVTGAPLAETLGVPLDRSGRVIVEPDLSIPGHPEVLVVGDLAHMRIDDQRQVPGVAPAAIQGGQHAADIITRRLAGHDGPVDPFRYVDKGNLATIGRSKAVAEVAGRAFSGLLAWLLWVVVHIIFLIGFRSRLFTMLDWIWGYFTYQRGARIVLTESEAAWPSGPVVEATPDGSESSSAPEKSHVE